MSDKIYLKTATELTKTAKSGEKVFIEYRNRVEEFEQAMRFESHDWEFTMRVYSNLVPTEPVKFFKIA